MSAHATAKRAQYTWSDYRTWPDDRRWEIIGGEAYAMSPAPSTRHQSVLLELAAQLHLRFRGKPCRVFVAPTDVRLSEEDVVQPDVAVVCERERIKTTHINGAPTLVVEILSPATALLDRSRKLDLYGRSGVGEVWLVTPYPSLIEVFLLEETSYRLVHAYRKDEVFASATFKALRLDLRRVFDFPLEPGEEIEMVKEGHPPYGGGRTKRK
jgi:Uma2 family endonuclease